MRLWAPTISYLHIKQGINALLAAPSLPQYITTTKNIVFISLLTSHAPLWKEGKKERKSSAAVKTFFLWLHI
jgi:hypothetical protein